MKAIKQVCCVPLGATGEIADGTLLAEFVQDELPLLILLSFLNILNAGEF